MIKFTTHIPQYLFIVRYNLLKFKTIIGKILIYWTHSLRLCLLNQLWTWNFSHHRYFLIWYFKFLLVYYIFLLLKFWWRRWRWLTTFNLLIFIRTCLTFAQLRFLFLRLISNNNIDFTLIFIIIFFKHIDNYLFFLTITPVNFILFTLYLRIFSFNVRMCIGQERLF